eukprot:gene19690-14300_t
MTKTATGKVLVETSPDFLSLNTSSVVTLTLRDDIAYQSGYDRYSSRSVTITMTSQPIASIRILSDVSSFVRVVPSAAVTILAVVSNARQPGGGQNTTCKWSSSTLPFTATTVGPPSMIQASIAPSKSVHMPLVIRAGALVAAGHYTFRLTCGSVWTEVSVSTNQAPYGGSMTVTPSTGLAFETSFVFSAVGWADDSAQEDPSSLELTYTFQYSPTNDQWTTIPNFAGLTYVDDVVLPCGGLKNTTSEMLPLRLLVTDAVGASTVFHTSVEVTAGGKGNVTLSTLQGLVANASSVSSLRVQQMVAALLASVSAGSTSMSLTSQVAAANTLLRAVNVSLLTTDTAESIQAKQVLADAVAYQTAATVALTQAQAKEKLAALFAPKPGNASSTGSSTSSLVSQTSNVLSFLSDALLSGGSTASSISVVTDTVRISVSVLSFSNTTQTNGTVGFLPTIAVPDSKSSIAIAQTAGAAGGAVVSVVEFDSSLFTAGQSNASTNATSPSKTPQLASDVLSLKITYLGNSTAATLPTFVANMS